MHLKRLIIAFAWLIAALVDLKKVKTNEVAEKSQAAHFTVIFYDNSLKDLTDNRG